VHAVQRGSGPSTSAVLSDNEMTAPTNKWQGRSLHSHLRTNVITGSRSQPEHWNPYQGLGIRSSGDANPHKRGVRRGGAPRFAPETIVAWRRKGYKCGSVCVAVGGGEHGWAGFTDSRACGGVIGHFPPQVILGALYRFAIRYVVVKLQEQHPRHQRRGSARSAAVHTVHVLQIVVLEQLAADGSHAAVERAPTHPYHLPRWQ